MPVAEKALPTTQKNHSGDLLIQAYDHQGHRLQMFGCITPSIFSALKKDYTIELEDDTYTDVTKTDWYSKAQKHLRRGGLVQLLRSHKGMSQGDLGKALGITSKYVSDIEHGRRPVSVKMAQKLSVVFGRRPERFLPLGV
jgi:DNA-binding XRE family transcriptional regulator